MHALDDLATLQQSSAVIRAEALADLSRLASELSGLANNLRDLDALDEQLADLDWLACHPQAGV